MKARLAWLAAVVAVAASPLERALVATMPRLVLVLVPSLLALGWVAGRAHPRRAPAHHAGGAIGLAFFVGSLAFWMDPRAVDAVVSSTGVAVAHHASLLVAGWLLARDARSMSFPLGAAAGIYAVAMLFAVGVMYTSYPSLLCGSFKLADQRLVGRALLTATPVALALLLALGARALAETRRA